MNLFKRISVVFSMLALITTMGCAATSDRQGTAEYVDDAVVTTRVKSAIFKEPTLKSAEINVETFKGIVQLSGFLSTRADIVKAIEVTRSVSGVKSVKDDMRLK